MFLNCKMFNGDASTQEQKKALETEFGTTFNRSNWNFQSLDPINGLQIVTIATNSDEKQPVMLVQTSKFTSVNLIQGINFHAYLFQSKTNTSYC